MPYTRNIKDATKKQLYAKSGNCCALCNDILILDNSSNISEICHIEAVKEGGARYNDRLTDEEVNSYDNLILLCPRCHTIVDDKKNADIYTVEFLKHLKRSHDCMIKDAMSSNSDKFDPTYFISEIPISEKIYDYLYEYSKEEVQTCIESIICSRVMRRNLMFEIVCMCYDNRSEHIDTLILQERSELDFSYFALSLMILDKMNYIEETKYINDDDGYGDENGDFHFVKNDYLFKAGQGEWYLCRLGKILVKIRECLGSAKSFYELICKRNIKLLS